jgi:hypothetical protein
MRWRPTDPKGAAPTALANGRDLQASEPRGTAGYSTLRGEQVQDLARMRTPAVAKRPSWKLTVRCNSEAAPAERSKLTA